MYHDESKIVVPLLVETYQIPRLYQLLLERGVIEEPPRNDFEAFRGTYRGSWLSISLQGEISYAASKIVKELIDDVIEQLTQPQVTESYSNQQYMVLARHSLADHQLPVNHLNIWLHPEQYRIAVEILESRCRSVQCDYSFEKHCFEEQGYRISFHENGKVIADEGYSVFAPLLVSAVEQNQPYAEYDLVIGQDEVGTGERIGPLVIGTVAATPQQLTDLQLVGIKDSKMVPHTLSTTMVGWIRDLSTLATSYQLEPQSFNQLVLNDRLKITDIITRSHNLATELMLRRLQEYSNIEGKIVYVVDQFDRYEQLNIPEESTFDIEVEYIPHGERHSASVAAASILAKAERFRWITLHEKVYQLKLRRRRIRQIRQHEKSHNLLKIL